MKSIIQIVFHTLLLLNLSFGLYSEENFMAGSHEDGERLLEESQYSKAENLAISLLTNNPSDPKAEFILTRAWIGLAREEKKRGNYDRAKQFFQKAYLKWPLNQELKAEIENLRKMPSQRGIGQASFGKSSGSNTVILLDSEIYRSVQDIKDELKSIFLQTRSYREQNERFSSKEKFYQTVIVVLGLFSLMNLVFTFLMWRRK
ncbi:tetratricopeptide repeat protein [Leptospira stimsonii]|uniref:Tetratricopeptide repeat protein n=1 Tax=Leptospira stimsonii TaxID=2202203 RepID=A0ABY2NDP4_9LEPT|nr:tetratricopeptide repeat protein [Leptospira stimsonii]TGK15747.1 tetratricopeptide repeat protein [Leptospira stimsonii]TGM22113.1 tetratricopeptide repeat protein [Leptospira stimsonii]